MTSSAAPHGPEDLYASPPPWDIGRPRPAFLALATAGAIRGRVLDAGCGTGEHVLMCAGLGLDAIGVDLASRALRAAEGKASDRGLSARFLHQDARRLADLGETFDTVLDCGLFHIFSDRQPGEWGRVRKVTQDEITASFAGSWRVDSVEAATIDITTDPDGIRAWLAVLTRIWVLGGGGGGGWGGGCGGRGGGGG